MRIVVIAGSPKGETSVTLQYVRYLEKSFSSHEWVIEHVASRIPKLERNRAAFDAVIDQVRSADLVLWAFPLYVLLVPAGYKRFIELIAERRAQGAFAGKYAASLSTSIHFHDNCAHDYVRAVSEDLGMRFVGSHSPEMHDLEKEKGQRQLLDFGGGVLDVVQARLAVPRTFAPLASHEFAYESATDAAAVDATGLRVVILHDARKADVNLHAMVERVRRSMRGQVQVHNLWDVEIKGNCLGCLRCARSYRCAWQGKDGFIDFYDRVLRPADVLVFAGTVVDRHLSSRWRQFFDRAFFNTHTPSFAGKQLGFLVSGPLSQMANLREVLTGYTQWQEANLVGLVSDEVGSAGALDELLTAFAHRAVAAARAGTVQPFDFHGVGGAKIFRDHIYGPLRCVFRADHRYYARTGFYDFPTWNWRERLLNALWAILFLIPAVRREFDNKMRHNMIRGLQKQVANVQAERAAPSPPALAQPQSRSAPC